MRIAHYEPLTLVDYPGTIAATVFTSGCVFRCPFCHSPELVDPAHKDFFVARAADKERSFFSFLEARRGKIDGVCVTGGEPTLHADLRVFLQRIKDAGFLIKLDTNGMFPDRIADLVRAGVVDYWAMDIKHAPDKYAAACGVMVDVDVMTRSMTLIRESGALYEFRTTVVPGLHTAEDLYAIGQWISGARAYYLQAFRCHKILSTSLGTTASRHALLDLSAIARALRSQIAIVDVRA